MTIWSGRLETFRVTGQKYYCKISWVDASYKL